MVDRSEFIKGQGFHTHPERINLKGRPKKWTSTIIASGYTKGQVTECIEVLISLTHSELNDVNENENASMLERMVSAALLQGYKKKSLYNLETLLSRVHGKPTEKIQAEITVTKFEVRFNDGPEFTPHIEIPPNDATNDDPNNIST